METYRLKIKGETKTAERQPKDEAAKRIKPYGEYTDMGLEVLGVPFGGPESGRDAQGEAFHADTNIWMNQGDTVPLTYYHGFGPDDPDTWQEDPAIIGMGKLSRVDERGYWFDVSLDMSEPLAMRLAEKPVEEWRASSGAVSHLVRITRSGMIDVWPVGEIALFDVNEWRLPANDFAVIQAKSESAELERESDELKDAAEREAKKIQTFETPNGEEVKNIMENENEIQEPVEEQVEQVNIEATIEEKVKAYLDKFQNKPAGKMQAPATIKSVGEADPEKAFEIYCRTGQKAKGLIHANKAALQEGTTTEGGFLVPNDFLGQIIAKRDEMSIARRAGARVIQTNRDYIDIPYEDTSETAFVLTAEEGAVDENEPTFGNAQARVYKYTKLVKVSEELLADDAANLQSFLGDAFGRAWAGTENGIALAGTGSGQPQGVLVGGTAGLTFDSATTIGAAEIPELFWKLGSPYHEGAVWVMKGATLGLLQGLTGNNFQFVPTPNSNAMSPQLWGKPVFLSDSMGAVTTGLKSAVYGNWYYYALIENQGMVVRRLNELYAGNGQVGFLATVRMGGVVLQAEAFQYGKQA